MDELLRAWAVLGLKPGTRVEELRKRYRMLARQWHPDRFTSDPQGQAEAALQMRALNAAYRHLLEAAVPAPASESARAQAIGVPQRGRLSREELDRLVAAIGTASPVDVFVDALPHGRRSASLGQWLFHKSPGPQWAITDSAAAGLAFLAGHLVMALLQWRGVDALNSRGWYLVYAAPLIVLLLRRSNR